MHATSKESDSPLAGETGRRVIFAVVAAAVFMTFLDQWVVNVALEAIGRSMPGTTLGGLSWIINAYTIALASLFIVAGRLGDRSGHRLMFSIGIVVFTLASLACALATSLEMLVAVRVVQAAGAALLLPASLSLLLASVPDPERHRAARLWSAVGAVAAASGPALGGLLIDVSWRLIFLINVPIGIAVVLLGLRVFPSDAKRDRQPLPDLVGSGLLVVGMSTLIGAIIQGPEWGWQSPAVLGLLAVAIIALGWFGWRCVSQAVPLIPPLLWRVRPFTVATGGIFLFSIAFGVMLLSNALWCQGVWGYSAFQTGLAMAPGPALVPFVAMGSNRLLNRFGPAPLIVVGCLLFAAGLFWRALVASADGSYVVDLLPSLLLGGIGNGLAFSTMIASGATSVPAEHSATAAGVINTGRQVASAIGVAVLVAVLGSGQVGLDDVDAFQTAWVVAGVLGVLAGVVACWLPRNAVSAVEERIGSAPRNLRTIPTSAIES